jgi:glycosyltransferase involved in cell wall biosynthesis
MIPLKVTFVTPSFAPAKGGLETHVGEISRRLADRGARIKVLTLTGEDLERNEVVDGVEIHRVKLPLPGVPDLPGPALIPVLRKLTADADVVHSHSYHALPSLAAALVVRSKPLVFTPLYHGTGHSPMRARLHRLYRPFGRYLVARADAIVALSEAEAQLLGEHFGLAASHRTTVIPSGVGPVSMGKLFSRPRATVLTCARLEQYKRVDLLVKAVAGLGSGVELVVVGDGPERENLSRLASELGVADRVLFPGRLPEAELARWRATATVFATLSEHESYGLTLAEALSGGTPTVASDIPAHREVVKLAGAEAVTCLVDIRNPCTISDAIAAQFGAPRKAFPLPTWNDVADMTIDIYRNVIQRRQTERKAG